MQPDIAGIAALIGDKARSKMLLALMGGKALTATELALEADITAATASSHLTKLVEGELLQVRRQGRHKYFQLKGMAVAQLLEQMLNLVGTPNASIVTGPDDARLRTARVCYDHLAGEYGVVLYDALCAKGYLLDYGEVTKLSEKGRAFFTTLGANIDEFESKSRPVCKSCLDWSERRNHVAGQLGEWILKQVFDKGWASRDLDSRAITFSHEGLKRFKHQYL